MYKRINFKAFENKEDVTIGEILDTVEDEQFKRLLTVTYTKLQGVMTLDETMIVSIIIGDLTGEKLESPLHLVEYLVNALGEEELKRLVMTMEHMRETGMAL